MDKKFRLSLIFQAAGNATSFLRGVKGESQKAGQALASARERVSQLQKTARDVSGFRKMEQSLEGTRAEIAAARAECQRLGLAMDAAERPTRQLSRAFEVAGRRVKELEAKQAGQVRSLQDLRVKLDAAGVSADALGAHELRLKRDIEAANGALAEQSRRLDAVTDRQRRMGAARGRYDRTQAFAGDAQGAGFSAIGAGAVVGAPLVAGVKAALDVESRMTTIAQRSNMSAEAAKRFERNLISSGVAANRTRDESLAMFDELTAQGFEAGQALAMGRDVGRAATAYQVDDGDLAATAGSLRNIKIEAEDTGRAFDVMAVAGKRGNFEFDAMAKAFPSLTAGAAAYRMTGLKAVAELSSAAQIARRGAGSDDEAATNLNNLLQKIGSPETARKFAKMGIDLEAGLKKGEAAGKSALETIIELASQATGGDASKLGLLFEDAQVQKALRPLMADLDGFRKLRDDALGAKGEVDRDFQRRMQDDGQAIKQMRIQADAALLGFGQAIQKPLGDAARAAHGAFLAYNKWAEANPGAVKTIATVFTIVAGGLLIFGGLAVAVAAVLGPFALLQLTLSQTGILLGPLGRGIAGVAGKALPWLGRGLMIAGRGFLAFGGMAARAGLMLLANPMTWIVLAVVAAVALLAAGAFLLVRNWSSISSWFAGVWQGISDAASAAVSFMTGIFMNFTPAGLLIGAIMRAWPALQALGGRFLSLGRHLLTGLINGVLGGIPALVRAVMRAGGSIIDGFKNRLGIRSPSRVFAQLGDYTMQGMGVGIERSADGQVRRMRAAAAAVAAAGLVSSPGAAFAGDRLSPALTPSLRLPAASAGRASGPPAIGKVEVHVHAAPGQDERLLARLVAEKLREILGSQAGEASLADGDDSWGET